MQSFFYEINRELNNIHKILNRIEGNTGCFNDVIVFKQKNAKPQFNLIYFGGDIQVKLSLKSLP